MKKIILIAVFAIAGLSCGSDDSGGGCGSHNGKSLQKGPDGGCYYINSSGNKTYVDRSECKC